MEFGDPLGIHDTINTKYKNVMDMWYWCPIPSGNKLFTTVYFYSFKDIWSMTPNYIMSSLGVGYFF